jgi:hypothetical protein
MPDPAKKFLTLAGKSWCDNALYPIMGQAIPVFPLK